MARIGGKNASRKYLVVLSCVALLGIALVADFLWASSSASGSSPYWSTNLDFSVRNEVSADAASKAEQEKKSKPLKDQISRSINATFADLPALHLDWEEMAEAPVPRLDGAAVQIKNLLYVFAGYGTIDYVHSHVDVYNFSDNSWGERFDMPKEMAHSHLGMATDGRYIYVVTGQYGPQCEGLLLTTLCLTQKQKLGMIYLLYLFLDTPQLRNFGKAGFMLWVAARKIAMSQHWNIGACKACVVANDKLFVIGGQEGDFMAKPGSPIFKCVRRSEVVYSNVYMLDDGLRWIDLPPMPKPDSHIEFAWKIVNNSIVIAGGTTEKHPVTKKMVLVGEIFRFNLDTLQLQHLHMKRESTYHIGITEWKLMSMAWKTQQFN
ncbi:hypothetical protein HPP92_007995 [Vanilla planifolia]|uniref:Kelch repeat-containing protein n=1 Tax=Vanilla planifolia TaxID=51239 RepID=A0A835RSH7_VANPL|nr:hypothetical protein HPP92_007995 [Vanilla planifolia]